MSRMAFSIFQLRPGATCTCTRPRPVFRRHGIPHAAQAPDAVAPKLRQLSDLPGTSYEVVSYSGRAAHSYRNSVASDSKGA